MNKKLLFIVMGALFYTNSFAAIPHYMDYEAIIHDANSALVIAKPVGMRISILQGKATGNVIYEETQTPVTNEFGVAAIKIGDGRIAQGYFPNINWALGPYFIKTEIDPTGGTNYTIVGTSELISVTHALHDESKPPGKTTGNQGINAGGTISIASANGFSGTVNDTGATAIITLNPLASPALAGTPTAPTAAAGTSTTQLATTAFVTTANNLKANKASPTFTGAPAAPTAAAGTNTTQLATTAFVTTAGGLKAPLASPTFTGVPAAPTAAIGTNTTQLATTAFVVANTGAKADVNNPTFTGLLTAPLANINGGTINNTTVGATSPSTGSFTNLAASGVTTLSNATPSTSTNTGALVVGGGLGVAGIVTAGGFVGPISATGLTGTVSLANGGTGASTAPAALTNLGAAPLASPSFTGNVTIPAGTINATSIGATTPGTGAFTNLTASGVTTVSNTTASTSTNTGALVVNGGLGVAGTITAGGFSGPVAASSFTGIVGTSNGGTGVTSATQNFVFAAPSTGNGAPSFRALVASDLPAMPAAPSGWSLTGNAGTVDGVNFIGTTDNVPFNIRVNNQKAGRIDSVGNNTFFGISAGFANTGDGNTAFGTKAS